MHLNEQETVSRCRGVLELTAAAKLQQRRGLWVRGACLQPVLT